MKYAIENFEQAFQAGAEGVADGICEDIHAVLDDPIVQALMAADRVDVGKLRALFRRIAASLRGEIARNALTNPSC